MADRNVTRNSRGQIVSYPIQQEGQNYGRVYFIEKEDGTQTKPARYFKTDILNNIDTEIKELSFPIRTVRPKQIARTKAKWGMNIGQPGQSVTFSPGPMQGYFYPIENSTVETGIPWPPYSVNPDGTITPLNYGNPGDVYPPMGSNGATNELNTTTPQPDTSGETGVGPQGQGQQGNTDSSATNFPGSFPIITTPSSGNFQGGGKIICNELYRQGFLSEEMWDADERYGDMMFEKDPKLVIGYQMWARKVVKYMRKNPNNTKFAYWLFKPWTEYMGYKMGVVKKPTLMGRFTNWIGSKFSYMVFDLYDGQKLLDKYNQKLAI